MKNTVLLWRVQNELSHCVTFCVVDGLGSDHVFDSTQASQPNYISGTDCTMGHAVTLQSTFVLQNITGRPQRLRYTMSASPNQIIKALW